MLAERVDRRKKIIKIEGFIRDFAVQLNTPFFFLYSWFHLIIVPNVVVILFPANLHQGYIFTDIAFTSNILTSGWDKYNPSYIPKKIEQSVIKLS